VEDCTQFAIISLSKITYTCACRRHDEDLRRLEAHLEEIGAVKATGRTPALLDPVFCGFLRSVCSIEVGDVAITRADLATSQVRGRGKLQKLAANGDVGIAGGPPDVHVQNASINDKCKCTLLLQVAVEDVRVRNSRGALRGWIDMFNDLCYEMPEVLQELVHRPSSAASMQSAGGGRLPGTAASAAQTEAADTHLLGLEALLQAKAIMRAYQIPSLLETYVSATREWLYKDVNEWLARAVDGRVAGNAAASRMYLLMAGPGMGKSVFSAVMHTRLAISVGTGARRTVLVKHFFKVGEPRAQASAMLRSLTYQMAEKLPGFAELLQPAAKEHGTGSKLSLNEMFEALLLTPLLQLEQQASKQAAGLPVVVMLLDALDEADDGAGAWEPVANLVAYQFAKLPACFKVILTSRFEDAKGFNMADAFKEWTPRTINPKDLDNQSDLRKVLTARLQSSSCVGADDKAAAVELLRAKAEVSYTMMRAR
jgi:hypothetical protein